MKTNNVVICLFLFLNVLTFMLYGIDKLRAKRGVWRISEKNLILLAIMGGCIGAWFGMQVWHHKTQHPKFRYGIPAIFIIQLSILLYCTIK